MFTRFSGKAFIQLLLLCLYSERVYKTCLASLFSLVVVRFID